ncbi:MAG: hypothetical protein QME60_08070 [Verrucomicrobiota bacterium]|nr:hypothetical protein [Verrucomicrobiota bacterium]
MKPSDLVDRLAPIAADLFRHGLRRRLSPAPRSAQALVAWSLAGTYSGPLTLIADGPRTLETLHRDLLTLAPVPASLAYFPAWEALPGKDADEDPDVTGYRLDALNRLLPGAALARIFHTPGRECAFAGHD